MQMESSGKCLYNLNKNIWGFTTSKEAGELKT